MAAAHPFYRSLVRLYPKDFREEYGDDLHQAFDDLVLDLGAPAAWRRTSVDLLVSIPRFHLENVMSERTSTTALTVTLVLLSAAGVLCYVTGFGPGIVLFAAAVVIAVAQRSRLGRSIRTPDTKLRRHRLVTAAVLAAVFAASVIVYAMALEDDEISGSTLVLVNLVGTPAMIGAIGFFIVGLLTPKAPRAIPPA